MPPITKDEIERLFRSELKKLRCLNCGEQITDAAIDWGRSQPSESERDGPFPIKCELCETEQFRRLGLSDAAVSHLAGAQIMILSVDAELCNDLWGRGLNAQNFNHHCDSGRR